MDIRSLKVAGLKLFFAMWLFATVPITVLIFDMAPGILASCGGYYDDSCGGCSATTTGEPKPLCCVVVRNRFYPHCAEMPCKPPHNCPLHCTHCNNSNCVVCSCITIPDATGDGTTGRGCSPKFKVNSSGVHEFFGFIRICPGSSSDAVESWFSVGGGKAEIFLDDSPFNFATTKHDSGGPCGVANYLCDNGSEINTWFGANWRIDGNRPTDIGLAAALDGDNGRWHTLRIKYSAFSDHISQGLLYHTSCCGDGYDDVFHGVTLYLGCGIDVKDSNFTTPRIANPGKFAKVTLAGIPVDERSPTNEKESDQPEDGFYIDTYNCVPTASFAEAHIPIEGGELALEFRRMGGVRSTPTATRLTHLPITYPTDDLLGPAWSTNLSAHAIISNPPNCDESMMRATFTDSGGTTYQYLYIPQLNWFQPEIYESQGNAALHAKPSLEGDTLILRLSFSTTYYYSKVARFIAPNASYSSYEDYYRLDYIEDRNGNFIEYQYNTINFGYPASKMLVSKITDVSHPARYIEFTYQDFTVSGNQNGYDWGIRLVQLSDPLKTINYNYAMSSFTGDLADSVLSGNRTRAVLTHVTYPQVENPVTGLMETPTQHYNYAMWVSYGSKYNNRQDPVSRVLHAGITKSWKNNDNSSGYPVEFTYEFSDLPVAVHPINLGGGNYSFSVETQQTMVVSSVMWGSVSSTYNTFRNIQCPDTLAMMGGSPPGPNPNCSQAVLDVQTRVTDNLLNVINYKWSGVVRPLNENLDPVDPVTEEYLYTNQTGLVSVILSLTRDSLDTFGSPIATAYYAYSNDLYGNLTKIIDMSGNVKRYFYNDYDGTNLHSREYNQPTMEKRVANGQSPDTGPETDLYSLFTQYEYVNDSEDGTFNKLKKIIDPEGMVTEFEFDFYGNRTGVIRRKVNASDDLVTTYTYDSGFITSITDSEGRLTVFERVFGGVDPDYCKITTIVDPYGFNLKTVRTYDKNGNIRKEIPPEGNTGSAPDLSFATVYDYDALGRVTKVTRPMVNCGGTDQPFDSYEETKYDMRGNVYSKRSPRGPDANNEESGDVLTKYLYDEQDRLIFTRIVLSDDPLHVIETEIRYDERGMVSQELDGLGNSTNYHYDQLLRLQSKDHDVTIKTDAGLVTRTYSETYYYEGGDGIRRNSGSGAFSYTKGWKPIRVIKPRVQSYDVLPEPELIDYAIDYKYDEFYRLVQTVKRRGGNLPDDPGVPAFDDAGPGFPAEPQELVDYNKIGNQVVKTVVLSRDDKNLVQRMYTYYDDFDRVTVAIIDVDGDGDVNEDPYPISIRVNQNDWTVIDSLIDSDDSITKSIYDDTGNVIQTIDSMGRLSEVLYDAAGRKYCEISPLVYDPFADPPGNVRPAVYITYYPNGNVASQQGPYIYDPNNNVPSGRLTGYTYDKQGRLKTTTIDLNGDGILNSSDIVTTKRYDRVGNVIKETNPRGYEIKLKYDRANRKISDLGPQVYDYTPPIGMRSPETVYEYDDNSNLTCIIDPKGISTVYEYDELNRQILEKKAAGVAGVELSTEKVFDENNNLLKITIHNVNTGGGDDQVTKYEYDAFDRMTKETLPGLQMKTMEYYRDGKIKTQTDPMGHIIESMYDCARRISSTYHKIDFGTTEETRTYVYDRVGNLESVTDVAGSTIYDYDALNRVVSETRNTTGQTSTTITSEYNLSGERTKITYPGTPARIVTNAYDPIGRLSSITDTTAGLTTIISSYVYDKCSNIIKIRESDGQPSYITELTSNYDALNRPTQRTQNKRTGGASVFNETLRYDLIGNILGVTESINGNSRILNYSYDAQYRLMDESWLGNGTFSYAYDRIGNRLAKVYQGTTTTYTYNSNNELQTMSPSTSFTYDANGNLITKTVSGGAVMTYEWDVSNRLKQVLNGSTPIFNATYDYRTRRLTLQDGNGSPTTYFVYDGGLCIQERASGAATINNSLIQGLSLGGGIGGLLYEVRGSSTRNHFTYNHVGHNVLQIDSSANVTAWSRYEAFGNRIGGSSLPENKRLANTKELDTSTGLYHHGFRYYDPEVGRYISLDPIGYKGGLNLYCYVQNNPVLHVDPRGLTLWDWLITGDWNPAPEVKAAAEQGIRESNIGGQAAAALAKTVSNAAGVVTDSAVVVGYTVITGEQIDADVMKEIAVGEMAKSQAEQVAAGEWTYAQGAGDAATMFLLANPIGAVAYGGYQLGEGIEKGDAFQAAEGAIILASGFAAAKATAPAAKGVAGESGAAFEAGTVGELRAAGLRDAHHVIQDAAVRDLPGYSTTAAPGVRLPGPSTAKGTAHYAATQAQRLRGGGTYAAERRIGYRALRRAGVSEEQARALIQQADDHFGRLGVTPETPTRIPGNRH